MSSGSQTFRTTDLPLAAYLHSTRRLPFIGCEQAGPALVAVCFNDPHGEAESISIEFEAGAQCVATAFYDSIRRLRKVMDLTSMKRTNHHGHFNRDEAGSVFCSAAFLGDSSAFSSARQFRF